MQQQIYHLQQLAERYETENFIIGDPSFFMHQFCTPSDHELVAFVATTLSYGSRKQFMPKIEQLTNHCRRQSMTFTQWIKSGTFHADIPSDDSCCYYRLYTYSTINSMLCALQEMLRQYGSMKQYLSANAPTIPMTCLDAIKIIVDFFASRGIEGIVPKNTKSSCKRVCMFLRWMVRSNSPVDLGLWNDIIDQRSLIMPMDTHVMQEARRLGLLQSRTASMASAIRLSQKMREIFPDDPLRGDFALFGLGVDESAAT